MKSSRFVLLLATLACACCAVLLIQSKLRSAGRISARGDSRCIENFSLGDTKHSQIEDAEYPELFSHEPQVNHPDGVPSRPLVLGSSKVETLESSRCEWDERGQGRKGVQDFEQEVRRWSARSGSNRASVSRDGVGQKPSVADIEHFKEKFKAIPPVLRREEICRALNLISDENTAVLTGVALDASEDPAVLKEIFADLVNRSEEVKEPILKEIAKDKTHPCSSDAEWIFAVTGERPE